MCSKPSFDGLTHPGCQTRYSIDGVFTSVAYTGIVKKLIYKFKYKPYLTDLRSVLLELMYESLIQGEEFNKAYGQSPVLVSIPLHRSKLRSRGYNQAEVLAKGLSKKLKLQTFNLLERIKPTRSQVGLDRKKRKENISGAFSIASNTSVSKYFNIFLVDDVLTTGSTLVEAARVLKRAGFRKVWGIALTQD